MKSDNIVTVADLPRKNIEKILRTARSPWPSIRPRTECTYRRQS